MLPDFKSLYNLLVSVLCVFITQGNLQFVEVEEDQLKISNPDVVANIASLLATTPDAVEKALCFRVVGNKLGAVEKMHTVEQAVYGRDAFAKAIYERLFTWIHDNDSFNT